MNADGARRNGQNLSGRFGRVTLQGVFHDLSFARGQNALAEMLEGPFDRAFQRCVPRRLLDAQSVGKIHPVPAQAGVNHRVQIFDANGLRLATIGQTGLAGLAARQLNHPARLALSSDGRLFIADSGNHRVVAYDVRNPRVPVEVASYGRAGAAGINLLPFDQRERFLSAFVTTWQLP